jgi:hypothetical protein
MHLGYLNNYNYSTTILNNTSVITEKHSNLGPRPTVFLNFLFRGKNISPEFYWFPQIGIANQENSYIIPLGIGVFLKGIFSISIGGLNIIDRRLDQYNVGDEASLELLNKDLKNRYNFFKSAYISINLSPGIRKK